MLRQRLIFSLIYDRGAFTQSRNFRLQKVGDVNWLEKHYQFQRISFSLDELIIVDASRGGKDIPQFCKAVSRLAEDVFIPVAAGGGIRTAADAKALFHSGADKIVLNTPLSSDPGLVKELSQLYGAQSIVAAVDYRAEAGQLRVYVNDGQTRLDMTLQEHLIRIQALGIGEVYLNSIDRDGTGFGYDLETIGAVGGLVRVPLIAAGGAGNGRHLLEGLRIPGVSAAATANLFNFIGDGLPKARSEVIASGGNLAEWGTETEGARCGK